jgi:hypothetical protein
VKQRCIGELESYDSEPIFLINGREGASFLYNYKCDTPENGNGCEQKTRRNRLAQKYNATDGREDRHTKLNGGGAGGF